MKHLEIVWIRNLFTFDCKVKRSVINIFMLKYLFGWDIILFGNLEQYCHSTGHGFTDLNTDICLEVIVTHLQAENKEDQLQSWFALKGQLH